MPSLLTLQTRSWMVLLCRLRSQRKRTRHDKKRHSGEFLSGVSAPAKRNRERGASLDDDHGNSNKKYRSLNEWRLLASKHFWKVRRVRDSGSMMLRGKKWEILIFALIAR